MAVLTRRSATASDSEFARLAHHRAYRDVVIAQFGTWNNTEQDRFFAETWNANPHEILICDGAPCGYLGVDFHREEIDLREIVILPEFQGRGLGSAILGELSNRSKSAHVPVKLRVLQKSRAAILYRRVGFEERGRTSTHFLMELVAEAQVEPRPIYVTLHGETEWNQQRRFQGRLDSALTETGREQARRAGVTLQRLIGGSTEVLIVISPLGRALETARVICKTLNVDFGRVEIDSRLAEIDLSSWAGLTREEVGKRWPDLVHGAGRYDWYFRSPDGERFEDLADRLAAWLTAARERSVVTIAVTHGVASRVLRGVYAGLPREKAITLENNRNVLFRLCDGFVDSVPYD
jgi:broad specificity phosphatase PhoE/ribosomal protein S18 acetylase RimI-like enzyme